MSDEHFTIDGIADPGMARRRAFVRRTASMMATVRTSMARSGTTRRMSPPPTPMRLYKKSYDKESKLRYLGHALVENRNGLIAAAMVTHADGYAERDAALLMLQQKQENRSRRITVGADKAFTHEGFRRSTVRELNVIPHVTKNNKGRRSNLDRRTAFARPASCQSLSLGDG